MNDQNAGYVAAQLYRLERDNEELRAAITLRDGLIAQLEGMLRMFHAALGDRQRTEINPPDGGAGS